MANRRVPLSNVPNAANSPFRAVALAASKRSRMQVGSAEGGSHDEAPPAKKQIVEVNRANPRTPPPRKQLQSVEGRGFSRRPQESQLTNFDKKLLAVKDKAVHGKDVTTERAADETLEHLRQWQRHYTKVFPTFVFYFESVPDEARKQCTKHLGTFGAREEKFFSKDVTHVVTTRSLPSEANAPACTEKSNITPANAASQHSSQSRTINPSLLEKSIDSSNTSQGNLLKSKVTLGSTSTRVSRAHDSQDHDLRRSYAGNADILRKAKEMGKKIWHLEKLGRILQVMSDVLEGDSQSQHAHHTRTNAVNAAKTIRQPDLSQLIRNEQMNGPADRDIVLATNDLISFKGPYIYIRDMNEKCKPIMVREYPKVQHREDGVWPQFRSVPVGKCPFVEEVLYYRRENEKEQEKEQSEEEEEASSEDNPPPTRESEIAAVVQPRLVQVPESVTMQPPTQANRKRPLDEMQQGHNPILLGKQQLPAAADREVPSGTTQSMQKCPRQHPANMRLVLQGGEPMASGMQASNITSAIRSQMISSTAAAPGAKAGTSREVHGLQRKVLERNAAPSLHTTGTSRQLREIASNTKSLRNVAPPRMAKQKAQEKLGHSRLTQINENMTRSEQEEVDSKLALRESNAIKALNGEKREPKPGYCENCREKFEDFEEHTLGRKHRKFATTKENWKELDALLKELIRPPRSRDELR
ncbi:hypothetical protein MMC13_006485 [Lambiella insularis]|nr:hypothetical protein [Lambiella insularis]